MADWEVVSDSLRPKAIHRGRQTPDYFLALMDGKTLRLDKRPTGIRLMALRYGFYSHVIAEKDSAGNKTGRFICWLTKKEG